MKWFVYFVPTVTMPELASRGGSIIEIFPAIKQDSPAHDWDEQKTGKAVESTLKALTRLHNVDIAVKRVFSFRIFRIVCIFTKEQSTDYPLRLISEHSFHTLLKSQIISGRPDYISGVRCSPLSDVWHFCGGNTFEDGEYLNIAQRL